MKEFEVVDEKAIYDAANANVERAVSLLYAAFSVKLGLKQFTEVHDDMIALYMMLEEDIDVLVNDHGVEPIDFKKIRQFKGSR